MNPAPTSALEVLLHKGPVAGQYDWPQRLTPRSISVAVDRLEKKALAEEYGRPERSPGQAHGERTRAHITKTFREHATAMEEAASVLSQEEPAPPDCSTQRDSFHRFRKP